MMPPQPTPHSNDSLGGKQSSTQQQRSADMVLGNSGNGVGVGEKGLNYTTLSGGVIRSVHPPGKGTGVQYKVRVSLWF